MAGPLSHIRVLDLSRIMAGPWAGQVLADLGADVIKVERPGVGDDTRAWGPPFLKDQSGQPTGEAGYYLSVTRGRRSITLDLDKPEGQAIVRAIAERSDIVLENFKVGTLERFGLDYASLKAVNPKIIYCSITGFGQTGPKRDAAAYDFMIQAMGGLMSVTGERDGMPSAGPARRTPTELAAALEGAGVRWAPINPVPEVFAEPQLAHRRMLGELPHPTAGRVPQVVSPLNFVNAPLRFDRAPPLLGQDTE